MSLIRFSAPFFLSFLLILSSCQGDSALFGNQTAGTNDAALADSDNNNSGDDANLDALGLPAEKLGELVFASSTISYEVTLGYDSNLIVAEKNGSQVKLHYYKGTNHLYAYDLPNNSERLIVAPRNSADFYVLVSVKIDNANAQRSVYRFNASGLVGTYPISGLFNVAGTMRFVVTDDNSRIVVVGSRDYFNSQVVMDLLNNNLQPIWPQTAPQNFGGISSVAVGDNVIHLATNHYALRYSAATGSFLDAYLFAGTISSVAVNPLDDQTLAMQSDLGISSDTSRFYLKNGYANLSNGEACASNGVNIIQCVPMAWRGNTMVAQVNTGAITPAVAVFRVNSQNSSGFMRVAEWGSDNMGYNPIADLSANGQRLALKRSAQVDIYRIGDGGVQLISTIDSTLSGVRFYESTNPDRKAALKGIRYNAATGMFDTVVEFWKL